MAKDESLDLTAFTRLVKFVPDDNLTLVVLKGHLVIEEQLVALLKAKHPKAIKDRFSEKLKRIGAMYPEEEDVWASIKKLNKVRNHLAHDLEATELKAKTKKFIDSLDGFRGDGFPDIETRTKKALIFLLGRLAGMK